MCGSGGENCIEDGWNVCLKQLQSKFLISNVMSFDDICLRYTSWNLENM